MRGIRFTRPTPSMAVALLALFVALGGTSYAAKKISEKDIRTGAVGTRAVKNGSLAGTDIRNNSLGPGVVAEQALDTGKLNVRKLKRVPSAGFAASVGKNTIGASELAAVTRRFGGGVTVANGAVAKASVDCKKGEIVVGGGGRWADDVPGTSLVSSFAGSDGSWTVVGGNGSGVPRRVQAFAMCLAP